MKRSQIKVRLQSHVAPEIELLLRNRAHDERRPLSREVEHFLLIGLKAEGLIDKDRNFEDE